MNEIIDKRIDIIPHLINKPEWITSSGWLLPDLIKNILKINIIEVLTVNKIIT